MLKPLHLLAATCCVLFSYGQKTDTLFVYYKTDQFALLKQDRQKLDSFLVRGWDRIAINGYTDETDAEDYNLELSGKRAGEVYQYFLDKSFTANNMVSQSFGEALPRADNNTGEGRALNRRTEIIGYRFAKPAVALKPKEDPMKPVTKTLDNGLIITYRPGALPEYMANNFAAGSGINFTLISNTVQMRQNNLYNNTTNGEILSSVMILCPGEINPCRLDSPVWIRVPIPEIPECGLLKVKFFNTVLVNGQKIWQEQNKTVLTEMIGGQTYMSVPVDSFCGCVNFDIKIPECFDTDSTKLLIVHADIKNLSAELSGLNSVYLPPKINDTTRSILFVKNKLKSALLSFSFYKGKKRIRSFRDQPVTSFPYDETNKQYLLSSGNIKFFFPDLNVYLVNLKVNRDKYRAYPEKKRCELNYLNRETEKILVDLMVIGPKRKVIWYYDQPIESIPFDETGGYRVIDKNFLKALKEKGVVAVK